MDCFASHAMRLLATVSITQRRPGQSEALVRDHPRRAMTLRASAKGLMHHARTADSWGVWVRPSRGRRCESGTDGARPSMLPHPHIPEQEPSHLALLDL